MMKDSIIGGQLIYSLVDENWRVDEAKKKSVLIEIKNVGAYVSIYLGGYLVIGGEQSALDTLLKTLPTKDNYPFQLPFHAATTSANGGRPHLSPKPFTATSTH